MKKGSPRDYYAETGCFEQLAQKSLLGEPHECYPLYRIGRTQENHQLLHKDSRRRNRSGGQTAGIARNASQLGGRPGGAVVAMMAVAASCRRVPDTEFEEIGPQNRGKIPSLQNAQENSSQQTGQE